CLDQRVDLVDALLAFGLVYALLSAHDDTRPRSRPQFSRVRIAVSRPSATALSAPASRSAASAASCASLVRPPGALSSNAKQRPLWIAMISGVPATTPRPCRILASIGLRKPPFAGWKAKTPGAGRARRCWNTARWIAASGEARRRALMAQP